MEQNSDYLKLFVLQNFWFYLHDSHIWGDGREGKREGETGREGE